MDKFIYVFDTAARDELLEAGFFMVKADEHNSAWVFALDKRLRFDLSKADFCHLTSNTLTF